MGAVSLALQGGCKPPVSRNGSKTGFAEPVLQAFGLCPGQGADAFVWVDSDLYMQALLLAYPDPIALRKISSFLDRFDDADPNALWDSLLLSTPLDLSPSVEHLANWMWLQSRSIKGMPVDHNGQFYGPKVPYGNLRSATQGTRVATVRGMKRRLAAIGRVLWPPVEVGGDLGVLATRDLSDCYVYYDPPYRGTQGFRHTLARQDLLESARCAKNANAVVVISEAEPIDELVRDGWHSVSITKDRFGQKRTASKQQAEYLTCSHLPQMSLFAV